jgi:hypothetical protein
MLVIVNWMTVMDSGDKEYHKSSSLILPQTFLRIGLPILPEIPFNVMLII